MELQDFRAEWADAVDALLTDAFGGPGEAALVRGLRQAGQAVVDRVALEAGQVVGHILFSPLVVAPPTIRVAALAPLAVIPARQRMGIGGVLIRDGLARCRALGFDAVALLGDPAYYRRFGFTRRAAFPLKSVYSGPAWQALELRQGALAGGPWAVTHPEAFSEVD